MNSIPSYMDYLYFVDSDKKIREKLLGELRDLIQNDFKTYALFVELFHKPGEEIKKEIFNYLSEESSKAMIDAIEKSQNHNSSRKNSYIDERYNFTRRDGFFPFEFKGTPIIFFSQKEKRDILDHFYMDFFIEVLEDTYGAVGLN